MRKILFLFLIITVLFAAGIVQASSIYVSNGSADIKVFIAKYRSDADLCVYVSDNASDAKDKDHIWYYTKYSSDAKARIRFVNYRSDADLVIYIVNYKSDAGWLKSSKYRGRL